MRGREDPPGKPRCESRGFPLFLDLRARLKALLSVAGHIPRLGSSATSACPVVAQVRRASWVRKGGRLGGGKSTPFKSRPTFLTCLPELSTAGWALADFPQAPDQAGLT